MELIIFDKKTFEIIDHIPFTDTFEIKLDLVISQKSTFKLSTININAKPKDIVFVKAKDFNYLGIIESIENEDGGIVLGTLEFKEILNREIKPISYNGEIASYLENIIKDTFIQNEDALENITYLSVSKETSKLGNLTFDGNKLLSISEMIELISKSYGVSVKEEIKIEHGLIKGIVLRIVNVESGLKLKAEQLSLMDLIVNESSESIINKVIFYPKEDNVTYKSTVIYYLLTDGTVTTDKSSPLRYADVERSVRQYSDNEYSNLLAKAESELSVSKTNHQITFTIPTNHTIIRVFENFNIGDFIEFRYKDKIYDSIVTALSFSNTLKACFVTLGEYRIKLTEKIQILSKSVNSKIGNIQITKGGFSDLDGGEY